MEVAVPNSRRTARPPPGQPPKKKESADGPVHRDVAFGPETWRTNSRAPVSYLVGRHFGVVVLDCRSDLKRLATGIGKMNGWSAISNLKNTGPQQLESGTK